MKSKSNLFIIGLFLVYVTFISYGGFVLFKNQTQPSTVDVSSQSFILIFCLVGIILRFMKVEFAETAMIILFDTLTVFFFIKVIGCAQTAIFLLGIMPLIVDWRNRYLICSNNTKQGNERQKNTRPYIKPTPTSTQKKISTTSASFTLAIVLTYGAFAIYGFVTLFQNSWNPDFINRTSQLISVISFIAGIVLRCLKIAYITTAFAIVADIITTIALFAGIGCSEPLVFLLGNLPFIWDWINRYRIFKS